MELTEQSGPMIFPCDFTIKVICHSQANLISSMLEIVNKHFPQATTDDVTSRDSKQSKYTALSITVKAKNQEQLDQLYQDFSDSTSVLMTL